MRQSSLVKSNRDRESTSKNRSLVWALCALLFALCVCRGSGAAAEENSSDRLSGSRLQLLESARARSISATVCASSVISKERTSSSSTDLRRESSSGCQSLPPSWFVSKLMLSLPLGLRQRRLPRRRPRRSRLLWSPCGDPVGGGLGRQPRASRRKHHGVDLIGTELDGKRLELLKEIVP